MRRDIQDPIWGQLSLYFKDPHVDEILVNGIQGVSVVAGVHVSVDPSPFGAETVMAEWLIVFARQQGVRLDPVQGAAGGRVKGPWQRDLLGQDVEFRWHAVLPPLTQNGPLFVLRRHRFGQVVLECFGGDPSYKEAAVEAVRQGRSLVISGPTGSGKSTLLAALLGTLDPRDRVVMIETLAEMPQLYPTWVRLLERPPNLEGANGVSLSRLLEEALRLRPDRLVLGEVRGAEAGPYVHAAMSGHGGALTTIHAGSVTEARLKLVSLAGLAMDRGGAPSAPILSRVVGAMDFVQLKRGSPPEIIDYEEGKEDPQVFNL